jgi:hypothetical protein
MPVDMGARGRVSYFIGLLLLIGVITLGEYLQPYDGASSASAEQKAGGNRITMAGRSSTVQSHTAPSQFMRRNARPSVLVL